MHAVTTFDAPLAFPLELYKIRLVSTHRALEVLAHSYTTTNGWLRFFVLLEGKPLILKEVLRIPLDIVDVLPDGSPAVATTDRSVDFLE